MEYLAQHRSGGAAGPPIRREASPRPGGEIKRSKCVPMRARQSASVPSPLLNPASAVAHTDRCRSILPGTSCGESRSWVGQRCSIVCVCCDSKNFATSRTQGDNTFDYQIKANLFCLIVDMFLISYVRQEDSWSVCLHSAPHIFLGKCSEAGCCTGDVRVVP